MLKATDLRKGKIVKIDNKLVRITDFQHITPGNWRGIVQIKFKDIVTGVGSQRRVSPEDKFEDGTWTTERCRTCTSRATATSSWTTKPTSSLRSAPRSWVTLRCTCERTTSATSSSMRATVSIELPPAVVLKVEYTEPGVRGNTVQNVTKPAKLETGLEVKVPNHINIGDKVRIDTRTGEFTERVND